MQVLTQKQIEQKIRRLAVQIVENNYQEKEIILVGINNNGFSFGQLIAAEIRNIRPQLALREGRIQLNPAAPLKHPIELDIEQKAITRKSIVVVDDVANTGRTLYYALRPLMDALPKRVQMAVLIDRTHKSFPIRVDYVGLSLATTLKDNINVQLVPDQEWKVFLD